MTAIPVTSRSSAAAWSPFLSRDEILDLAFTLALVVCGLYGFGRAYGGTTYLVVGGLGVLLGAVVAVVADRLRAPAVTVAAVTIAVFFVLGNGVALGARTGGLPTLDALRDLADAAIRGWSRLLTVLPPAGRTGNLMAIPYLLGLAGTVAAYALARRAVQAWVPLPAPVAVLALSILFGTDEPSSLLVQGAAFATLGIGWVAVRARRRRRVLSGSSMRRNLGGAALLLAAALGGGLLTGPHLPLADARDRQVLRNHVDPPFDPRAYPSPLSQFRKFALTGTGRLRDRMLFRVDGLPSGALIRIATMDSYDGTVWSVSGGRTGGGQASRSQGYFQRVGESIPTTQTGTLATVTVAIGDLGTVWVPDAGVVTAVRFEDGSHKELTETFRYNRITDTAVAGTRPAGASRGLRSGDRYQLDVVLPPTSMVPNGLDEAALALAGPLQVSLPAIVSMDAVRTRASDLVGDASTPYARARAVEKALRQGYLSDGGQGQQPSDAGHYAARLNDMLTSPDSLAGNAEQYAALMAVMMRELEIPARVVLGVKPPASTGTVEVKGKDVTAWVEVGLQGIGWVPLFPTPDADRKQPMERPRPKQNPQVKEPPKVVTPPRVDTDVLGSGIDPETPKRPSSGGQAWIRYAVIGGSVVGVPLLMALLVAGALVVLKLRRRARRRGTGDPATRIAGGWSEFVDLGVDVGAVVPVGGTRREVATVLAHPAAIGLAVRADAAVFAPGDPGEQAVLAYWAEVDDVRSTWLGTLTPIARLRTQLSLRSLRGTGRPARRRIPWLRAPWRRWRVRNR